MENETDILVKTLLTHYEKDIRYIHIIGNKEDSIVTIKLFDSNNMVVAHFEYAREMVVDYNMKSKWIAPQMKEGAE